MQQRTNSDKSTAKGVGGPIALTTGIVSVLLSLTIPVIGLVIGVVGLIISISVVKNANYEGRKAGSANGGLTLTVIAIVLSLLMIFIPVLYQGMVDKTNRIEQSQQ